MDDTISLGEPLEPTKAKTDAEEKIAAASARSQPAADCPVLIGVDAIAAWLGITRGRCRGLVDDSTIPTFRLPGRSVRCALKSSIGAAMVEYAKRPGACAKSAPRKPNPPK